MNNFVDSLTAQCAKANIIVHNPCGMENNAVVRQLNESNNLSTHVICVANLLPNLSCYVLSNGIGVFLLADFDSTTTHNLDDKPKHFSKVLLANYKKKISQKAILNPTSSSKLFAEEKKLMLTFREICWSIIENFPSRKHNCSRPCSGTKKYRYEGLSYVVTIYIRQQRVERE